MIEPIWVWTLFILFVLAMLFLDLKVFQRTAHEVKIKEALGWSAVWIALAFVFNAGVYYWHPNGKTAAMEFLAGYLIEKSLSVDNLFVFLLIFSFFRVPAKYQHSILFWGILGALVMRGLFIWVGTSLVQFKIVIVFFGAFLVYTGIKLCFNSEPDVHPEKSRVIRLVRRFIPLVPDYGHGQFFVKRDGKKYATMMFLVLVFVETTDVVFAIDSIPAILAITHDPFIVFTSNVFAILGLRALYFALAGLMKIFHYLNYGLAFILTFVGIKMLAASLFKFHIPTGAALGVIAGVLALSIVASLIWPKESELPEGAKEVQHQEP